MIFRQLFDKTSSTYTYLLASAKGREALIIDPVLENVERYTQLLTELDLKLVKVIDTHIHADHISGIAELRDRTNCVTIMGDKTPADVVSMQVSDEELIKIIQKYRPTLIMTSGLSYGAEKNLPGIIENTNLYEQVDTVKGNLKIQYGWKFKSAGIIYRLKDFK